MSPAVDDEAPATSSSDERRPSTGGWSVRYRGPIVVFVAALLIRILAALIITVAHDGYLIEDESTYVLLSEKVAAGESLEPIDYGYGQSLYESRRAYLAPLAFLYRVFGPTRFAGQLLAAVFGAVTAALTVVLARKVTSLRSAWVAGAVVAVFPSQVLWSSVVLPESMVWMSLAALALGVGVLSTDDSRRRVVVAAGCAVALLLLDSLRVHMMVVAVWAAVLAVGVATARRLGRRSAKFIAPLVGGALVLPMLVGQGVGGSRLVTKALDSLSRSRAYLAIEADLPIAEPERISLPDDLPVPSGDGSQVITSTTGDTFVVRDGLAEVVRHVPTGLVGVMVRPAPWERPPHDRIRLGRAESVAWWMLYALAATGALLAWRQLAWLAFPVLLIVGFALVGSIAEGDVGTAFRHRGQILWALVVLAMVAVDRLISRRGTRAMP